MTLKVSVYSHIGNSRENQEDNFLVCKGNYLDTETRDAMARTRAGFFRTYSFDDESFCLAISDGMGGYENGETASLFAVSYISDHYMSLCQNYHKNNFFNQFVSDLNNSFCAFARKNRNTQDMGATLCGVAGTSKNLTAFNVGDSRLYKFTEKKLFQITIDNTEGQRLLRLGLLTEDELINFPKRKAIYKYLGKDVELFPDVYELGQMNKGDMLLLCSDGLSDVMDEEDISRILGYEHLSIEDKTKQLINEALEYKIGKGDNITVILSEFV